MTKMDNNTKRQAIKKGGKSSLIHENFFNDEKIELLPVEARYMLIGLIVKADLWGCYYAIPSTIRRQIFYADPKYTDQMIGEWLKQLQDMKIIHVYEGDDNGLNKYLIFTKWQVYQNYRYIPYPEYPLPPNWEWTGKWADKYAEIYVDSPTPLAKLQKEVKKIKEEEKAEKKAVEESKHSLNNILEAFYAHFDTPKPSNKEWVAMLPGTKALLDFYKGDIELTKANLIKAGEYYKDQGRVDNWWKDKWFLPKFFLQKVPGLVASLDKSSGTGNSGGGTPASKVPDIL